MHIPVNQNAPVKSRGELIIHAPIEKLWHVLTDIDHWPSWQSAVTESKLSGSLAEGTIFRWKAGGLSFVSKIHTIKPYHKFGWTGKTIGTSAIHNWFFEEHDGQTLLIVEECLEGFLPRLFRGYFQKMVEKGIQNNLRELQTAAERNT
jgi:uncharacterized protein YndB with AHSA1/START domain